MGVAGVGKVLKNKLVHQTETSNKYLALYLMMTQWVRLKQENKSAAQYLERYGYKKIAIYDLPVKAPI